MKEVSIENCHACGLNMRFELDMELNGNHVINCPSCGHEHCRVIEDGKVSSERWDMRNGVQTFVVQNVVIYNSSNASVYYGTTGMSSASFLACSWQNAQSSSTTGGW